MTELTEPDAEVLLWLNFFAANLAWRYNFMSTPVSEFVTTQFNNIAGAIPSYLSLFQGLVRALTLRPRFEIYHYCGIIFRTVFSTHPFVIHDIRTDRTCSRYSRRLNAVEIDPSRPVAGDGGSFCAAQLWRRGDCGEEYPFREVMGAFHCRRVRSFVQADIGDAETNAT